MTKIIRTPDQCLQGPGEIGRLHEYSLQLGSEFLVVAREQTMASMPGLVEQASGDGHEEEED